jgi:hypothetical protein
MSIGFRNKIENIEAYTDLYEKTIICSHHHFMLNTVEKSATNRVRDRLSSESIKLAYEAIRSKHNITDVKTMVYRNRSRRPRLT